MYFLRACVIFISLLFAVLSADANRHVVYTFTGSDTFSVPWESFSYLEDTRDTLTINHLRNDSDRLHFTPLPSAVPAVGFSSHTYWIRFTAHNPFGHPVSAVLTFDDANIRQLTFYQLRSDTTITCTTGTGHPFRQRDVNDISFSFNCFFPPQSTSTVYLKCRGMSMGLPVFMVDNTTFRDHQDNRHFSTGFAFGMILFFGIAALYLSIIYRDVNYCYFTLFILCYSFMLAVRDGLSFKYFWPSHPYLQWIAFPVTFALSSIFSIIFSTRFLSANHRHKHAISVGYGIIGCWIVSIVVSLAGPYHVSGFIQNMMIIITVIYVPAFAILTYRHHDQASRFYFVIWSIFLVFILLRTVIHTFALQGPPPLMQFLHTGYNQHTGIVIAAVFTSLAIGARLRKVQRERNRAKLEASALRQKTLELQLTNLQTRIQPHFLFNILNTIANLIVVDADKAEEALIELSEFYRSILKHVLYNTIRLDKEIDIVRQYLQLEKIRFGKRLAFNLSIDKECNPVKIPTMAVQVLVENCLKHGIHPKLDGGTIFISTKRTGERCRIVVDDTGVGLTSAKSNNGTGLLSLRGRLDLAYDNDYSLEIMDKSSLQQKEQSGVRVVLNIPLSPKVTTHDNGHSG